MPHRIGAPFWKRAPFLSILVPLMAGILLQWYFQLSIPLLLCTAGIATAIFISLSSLPAFSRFRLGWLTGFLVFTLFSTLGSFLVYKQDLRNNKQWFGLYNTNADSLTVTLQEPLVEKPNSYKALASVNGFKGRIIIYFKKDSSISALSYGSQISFNKSLQEIRNAGNPGGFDYKRHCLMRGISHQVYLKGVDFTVKPEKNENWLDKLIFSLRANTVSILQRFIKGEKEQGLAEALLIGYKNDLDKTLVQSYTNTGVVHVIAISGLHLVLVYWLLIRLLMPLKKVRLKWLHPLLVLIGLWLFSLLAGAQPSVLRAALMFSIFILADIVSRKASVLNSLAASAFILLCFNPFMLWDVGFQLSYAALLSLIVFAKPVYKWFIFDNKILSFAWALVSTSIAAQLLTTPISIYHFHQFPLFFLLANFLAVPLSSLVVLGELLLCIISFIAPLAAIIGKLTSFLIVIMNTWIERIEMIPYTLWDSLQISVLQTISLFFITAGLGYWLLEKSKPGLWTGIAGVCLFAILRSYSFAQAEGQQKLIVYNVSKHSAIDIIEGRKYLFIGDEELLKDDFPRNFNLKPSRILHRISPVDSLSSVSIVDNCINWQSKKIMLLGKPFAFDDEKNNRTADLIIISKEANPDFAKLNAKQIVFDGSLPFWKVRNWKRECDSLHLTYHDVATQGAYILNQ